MAGEWTEQLLGGLLSFSNGKSSPERSDRLPHPVYGSNGIIGFSDETNSDPNTIVVGRVGSYCGSLHYSDRACWVTDNAIRATARDENDTRFLLYLLQTLQLNNWRAGSGQPLLNQTILSSIPVTVPPPLPEQRAIAHILGTLDDKIELNRRMNETLEAMARALFKDWFVDFGPTRTKIEGRDPYLAPEIWDLFPDKLDEDGKPEGWETKALSEVIELNPERSLRKGAVAPYLAMANMPTKGHRPSAVVDRFFGSGMRFSHGDTLVARITPCLENGKTAYVDFLQDGEIGWGSTEYIVMRPEPPFPNEFAYCLARSTSFREFAIQNMTGTSGRQRVPVTVISNFHLPLPIGPDIPEVFGKFIKPIFSLISYGARESDTLTALRDALLPGLMSGEIRVGDADKIVKEFT